MLPRQYRLELLDAAHQYSFSPPAQTQSVNVASVHDTTTSGARFDQPPVSFKETLNNRDPAWVRKTEEELQAIDFDDDDEDADRTIVTTKEELEPEE